MQFPTCSIEADSWYRATQCQWWASASGNYLFWFSASQAPPLRHSVSHPDTSTKMHYFSVYLTGTTRQPGTLMTHWHSPVTQQLNSIELFDSQSQTLRGKFLLYSPCSPHCPLHTVLSTGNSTWLQVFSTRHTRFLCVAL